MNKLLAHAYNKEAAFSSTITPRENEFDSDRKYVESNNKKLSRLSKHTQFGKMSLQINNNEHKKRKRTNLVVHI